MAGARATVDPLKNKPLTGTNHRSVVTLSPLICTRSRLECLAVFSEPGWSFQSNVPAVVEKQGTLSVSPPRRGHLSLGELGQYPKLLHSGTTQTSTLRSREPGNLPPGTQVERPTQAGSTLLGMEL
ncbi:hypothetical protein J4Q44_G00351800 [Coregonus suidteri]|uniref:Uncharacterized protein n=1 Tax=Coregonus suidteri TaxID=861788 RepID=A0AAN8Q7S4_9TELE